MALLDDINMTLRDFEVVSTAHPAPTGDPASGVHNLRKHDLRQLLKTIAQTMGDPEALQDILSMIPTAGVVPLIKVGGTGDAITATMAPGFAEIAPGAYTARFEAVAGNAAANPKITIGGVTRTIRDVDGEEVPAGALVSGRTYTFKVAGPSTVRLIAGEVGATALAASGVVRTETTSITANTVVVRPRGGWFSGLIDGAMVQVTFYADNGIAAPVLKVGNHDAYPIHDAYGAPIPRLAVSAGETALVAYMAAPAPHFRLMRHAYRSGVMQVFASRSALEAAATAGATLPADGVFVAGLGSAGDGGHCFMSRASQVFRSPSGFGIAMGPDVHRKAFGIGMTGSSETLLPRVPQDFVDWRSARSRGQSDVAIQIPPTGLYFLGGGDWDRIHQIRFSADNQVVEIDASTIDRNRPFKITSLARTGCRFVIDGGVGGPWENEGGGRYLICEAGATIEFIRVEPARLYVTALRGGGVSSTNDFTRAPRTQSVLVAGQSILRQALGGGEGGGAFFDRYAQLVPGTTTNFITVASGGSGICERDGTADNWWVDMTNPSNPADGPKLIEVAAEIASRDGDMGQPPISAIFWDQGQTSAGVVDAQGAANPNFTRKMYVDATIYVLSRLRALCGGDPPVIFQRIGWARRPVVSDWRWQVIREAQVEVVNAAAGVHLGPETWDLPYKDNLHPDGWGQYNIGVRLAEALATVRGVGGLPGPLEITAVEHVAASRYANVTLSGPVGPLFQDPFGFEAYSAGGVRVGIARIHWISSLVARLFFEADMAGGTLYYGRGVIDITDPMLIPRRSKSPSIVTLAQPIRPSKHAL